MSTSNAKSEDTAFAEEAALTSLLGTHPKVKILVVLLSEGRDINVSEIAKQAGMSRSTVYNHLGALQELGVVEKTREIRGSPLYQLNRESEVAKRLGELEWTLLEEFEVEDDQ